MSIVARPIGLLFSLVTLAACGGGGDAAPTTPRPPPPPVAVASVVVALSSPQLMVGGNTVATATLRGANNELLAGRTVVWATSNLAVASVNAAGLVTTLTAGSATITATSEGQSGSSALTVIGAPVSTIVVSGPGTLSVGQTSSYSATLRDASGAVLIDRSVSWRSTNNAVATVSAAGVVSAVASGTTVISAASEGRIGTLTRTVRSSIAAVTITGGTRVKVWGSVRRLRHSAPE